MSIQNDSVRYRLIYILELENGNYYVGQTVESIDKRVKKHFKGKGAAWTKKHSPKMIKEVIKIGEMTYSEAEEIENQYVVQYMKKYGWDKVRGGYFTLSDNTKHFTTLKNHQKMDRVKGLDLVVPLQNS